MIYILNFITARLYDSFSKIQFVPIFCVHAAKSMLHKLVHNKTLTQVLVALGFLFYPNSNATQKLQNKRFCFFWPKIGYKVN